MMAEALCEWAHMMYNVETAAGVLKFVISYLQEAVEKFEEEIRTRRRKS